MKRVTALMNFNFETVEIPEKIKYQILVALIKQEKQEIKEGKITDGTQVLNKLLKR